MNHSKINLVELSRYFALPDTPAAGSPVGVTMVKVLEKYPELSLEVARSKANALLFEAAGRKHYRLPKVLSEAELGEAKKRLRALRQMPDSRRSQVMVNDDLPNKVRGEDEARTATLQASPI